MASPSEQVLDRCKREILASTTMKMLRNAMKYSVLFVQQLIYKKADIYKITNYKTQLLETYNYKLSTFIK